MRLAGNHCKSIINMCTLKMTSMHLFEISIIIPSWNGLWLLKKNLSYAVNQKKVDHEIIVVDNGSNDGTSEWINKAFPDVKVIKLNHNYGFAAACNHGIRHSQGRYIALVNNDVKLPPDWSRKALNSLKDSPDAGFISSLILMNQGKCIDSAGDFVYKNGAAWKRGHNRSLKSYDLQKDYVFSACAAASVYRRSMLKKTGLFNARLFAYYEDVDLAFRAHRAGYRCLFDPEVYVTHKCGATSRKLNSSYLSFLTSRNVLLVTLKNLPLTIILANLPRIMAFHIHDVIVRRPFNRMFSALKGKLSALLVIPEILRYRNRMKERPSVTSFGNDFSFINKKPC